MLFALAFMISSCSTSVQQRSVGEVVGTGAGGAGGGGGSAGNRGLGFAGVGAALSSDLKTAVSAAAAVYVRPERTATRVFSGPGGYPPKGYAAYGIIVFKARSTDFDYERHAIICEAYISSLISGGRGDLPRPNQVVTVWPLRSKASTVRLNSSENPSCSDAIGDYDLRESRKAIKDAEILGIKLAGRGPFLIIWSPGDAKGDKGAVALLADLSAVETIVQAKDIMYRWSRDIENDPSLWDKGWDIGKVRILMRDWLDKYGKDILKLFG